MTGLLMAIAGGVLVISALGLAGLWTRSREALKSALPKRPVRSGAEAPPDHDCAEARGADKAALAGPDPPKVALRDTAKKDHRNSRSHDGPKSVLHEVPSDVSEFLVPDFRPGLDMCRVTLTYPDIDFVHWRAENGVTLAFYDGEERLTLVLYGLSEPPLSDILIVFEHPRRGEQRYLLSELVTAEETELPPGPGDWPNASKATDKHNKVTSRLTEFVGFDPGAECIEIILPDGAAQEAMITVQPSDDGKDALVLVDGRATAILRGAPGASSRNVRLVEAASDAA